MRDAHIHSFLVGEAFMRAPDPGVELERLFS
jgi:indole-3-glycerol phosphate synthase